MTALTDRQTHWLRGQLGALPADEDLQTLFDDLDSVRDVAIKVLRDRRTALLDSPLSVNVSGVASVNNTENVKALERDINALVGLDDDPSDDEQPSGTDPEASASNEFYTFPLARTRGR